jgi:hypothetical protein
MAHGPSGARAVKGVEVEREEQEPSVVGSCSARNSRVYGKRTEPENRKELAHLKLTNPNE